MSCIDLIFCRSKNIISNHGVDVTIFEKCHHNIFYGKISIQVSLPPVYSREVWDYNKENIENINKVISNFNCTKAFQNLSVNEKVELLNETLLNIYLNYMPNKKIKCNYCQLPWMTDNIKKFLEERSKLTKIFYKNGQRKTDRKKVLKKLLNVLMKFLKLKRTIFLR